MALSGTFRTNVGAGWRLQLEWSATQNITNNTSTITARLYWMSLGSAYTVNSSASKSGRVTIDGSNSSFSGSGLARLSSNQKKLVKTYTRTVSHNSNGTKSVSISAYFDINVTLSGRYYGRVSVSGTASLNTIPRKSTMTTSRNWTAGSNRTITISRASTSFNHQVYIDVQRSTGTWTNIKRIDFSTSQTSRSTSFTAAQHKAIFTALNGRTSAPVRMNLRTYSGSTYLGVNTYTGTVSAPSASVVTITNPTGVSVSSGQGHNTVYIDQSIGISISRSNSGLTHRLQFKDSNSGNIIHTANNVGTSYTWTPSAAERDRLYARTPNGIEFDGQIDVTTYYDGVQVRGVAAKDINYRVRNSEPTFTASQISHDDTNSTTTGITGNNQYIIQNHSTLRARIISAATARNGATMREYRISVSGINKTQTGTGYNTLGTINASTDVTLTVSAIDSRGMETRVTRTIPVVPYKSPVANTRSRRVNGFEDNTTISLNGSISPLRVGSSNRNSVVSAQFQYREQGKGSYTSLTSFSITSNIPNYSATNRTIILDNQRSWDVRVIVRDRLGTTQIDRIVEVGRPIFFMDKELKSLGFNDYPQDPSEFRFNGRLVFGSTLWADTGSGGLGEGVGAIELNNSDIIEANGIYFRDVSQDDNGEGLLFIKSGYPAGSTNRAHHDNFLVRNGTAYLNGKPIGTSDNEILWSGAIYMQGGQTVTPSKAITNCPTGWILVWGRYASGTAYNDNWHFTFIPRAWQQVRSSNGGIQVPLGSSSEHFAKYLYCSNTTITGHDRNREAPFNTRVLRYVISY